MSGTLPRVPRRPPLLHPVDLESKWPNNIAGRGVEQTVQRVAVRAQKNRGWPDFEKSALCGLYNSNTLYWFVHWLTCFVHYISIFICLQNHDNSSGSTSFDFWASSNKINLPSGLLETIKFVMLWLNFRPMSCPAGVMVTISSHVLTRGTCLIPSHVMHVRKCCSNQVFNLTNIPAAGQRAYV